MPISNTGYWTSVASVRNGRLECFGFRSCLQEKAPVSSVESGCFTEFRSLSRAGATASRASQAVQRGPDKAGSGSVMDSDGSNLICRRRLQKQKTRTQTREGRQHDTQERVPPLDKDRGSRPGCRLRHLLCELRKGAFPLGASQWERMEVSSGEWGGLQLQSGERKGAVEAMRHPRPITGAHRRCSPLVVAAGVCGCVQM